MRFFRKWKISRDDFRRRRSSRQCERRACPALGRNCYRHLWMLTRKHTTAEMADLIPSLDHLIPLAGTFEKRTFSPWTEGGLHQTLVAEQIETLVMTGARRNVCVLAAVLCAIDLKYHVVLVSDGFCSGTDGTHDAAFKLLGNRFSVQLEVRTTEEFSSSSAVG